MALAMENLMYIVLSLQLNCSFVITDTDSRFEDVECVPFHDKDTTEVQENLLTCSLEFTTTMKMHTINVSFLFEIN